MQARSTRSSQGGRPRKGPVYLRHGSRAFTYVYDQAGARRQVALGEADSPESLRLFGEVAARALEGAIASLDELRGIEVADGALTLGEMIARFLAWARGEYQRDGKPTREYDGCLAACEPLRIFEDEPAEGFTPKKLQEVREAMVRRGWCRRYVNQQTGRLRRVFKWAGAEGLVPGRILEDLRCVSPLRRGRTAARESDPVRPVARADVDAILAYVPRQVAAMIEVQWHTGCRPGEVIGMRSQDVDHTGKLWLWWPFRHKTEAHGHERVIPLGPRCQEILQGWLRLDGSFLFQPDDALAEHRQARRAGRRTPLWPSHVEAKATEKRERAARGLRREPGDFYTVDSYRRAIDRGTRAANAARIRERLGALLGVDAAPLEPELLLDGEGKLRLDLDRLADVLGKPKAALRKAVEVIEKLPLVEPWGPHRLRHTAATRIRRELSLDHARAMLGHRSPVVTDQFYAERDLGLAEEVARRLG